MSETEMGGYAFENEGYCKIIVVDDSIIEEKSKISCKTVLDFMEEKLVSEGYEILDSDVCNLKISAGHPQAPAFDMQRNDGTFSAFAFKLEKFGYEFYAVYQPFSGMFGVFRDSCIRKAGSLYGQKVQFDICYYSHRCECYNKLFACRRSRCYKVKRRWFSDILMLSACEDRMVSREVKGFDGDVKNTFYRGEIMAVKINKYSPMSFDFD